MASIDQQTAALRWPSYQIEGSGRCAVVLECTRRVVLCLDPISANAVAASHCGPGCCHEISPYGNWHKSRTLDIYPQPPIYAGRIAALMEDLSYGRTPSRSNRCSRLRS